MLIRKDLSGNQHLSLFVLAAFASLAVNGAPMQSSADGPLPSRSVPSTPSVATSVTALEVNDAAEVIDSRTTVESTATPVAATVDEDEPISGISRITQLSR
jgi:hypothetical protein